VTFTVVNLLRGVVVETATKGSVDITVGVVGGSSGGGSLTPTFTSLIDASVIAHDGTFLGIVSRNQFASDSICNDFGSYGSQFSSTSIFNDFGTYGSQFSSKSAFNDFTSTPPRLISSSGAVLGRLTTNQFVFGAVNPIALVGFLGCTDVLN
jgi:hypothetical protein